MSEVKTTSVHTDESRFGFGKNWGRYLALVDDERIASAEKTLKGMLKMESLEGVRSLDAGSGSVFFAGCKEPWCGCLFV